MLREDHIDQDDISAIMSPTSNAPGSQAGNEPGSGGRSICSISQVSLNNASQAFNRRRIEAYVSGNRYAN
jgi:hypothetical protein